MLDSYTIHDKQDHYSFFFFTSVFHQIFFQCSFFYSTDPVCLRAPPPPPPHTPTSTPSHPPPPPPQLTRRYPWESMYWTGKHNIQVSSRVRFFFSLWEGFLCCHVDTYNVSSMEQEALCWWTEQQYQGSNVLQKSIMAAACSSSYNWTISLHHAWMTGS